MKTIPPATSSGAPRFGHRRTLIPTAFSHCNKIRRAALRNEILSRHPERISTD